MVEGTQVGAYRVVREIGHGGMGAVWLAEHVQLGRRAAIKVLHSEFSGKPDIVQRFFNEARAATAISDPGIVQIFDFGQHTDGSAYIVMELLEGDPLDRRLKDRGALPIADALRITRQVASTLGAAHTRGIVHRDVKPENIFLVHDPEVPGGERAKILDFGIAKLAGNATGVKTQTSSMMGTPVYMSPEQCRGAGHVDQRSDVYSLGCVLFYLVVGRPPFVADGGGELIVMHVTEAPPVPSQLQPGIPREIDQLLLRCLEKDPAKRFSSCGDLAIAIGALLGSSPSISVAISRPSIPVAALAATTLSSATGATGVPIRTKRKPVLAFALGLGVVAVGGVAAFIALRGGGDGATPSVASDHPAKIEPALTTPAPPPKPTPPDPKLELEARMKAVLSQFVAWSHDHAGAPCPDAATLGDAPDPWGHPFQITCTDQPGGQIVGAISAGPDGALGTDDDIASWQLGRDVTDLVHGARWVVAPAKAATPTKSTKPTKPTTATVKKPVQPKPDDGKPAVQLDENGLPTAR